jgi:hypothetical protein
MLPAQEAGGCQDARTARAYSVQRHFAPASRRKLDPNFSVRKQEERLAGVTGMENEAPPIEPDRLRVRKQPVDDVIFCAGEFRNQCFEPLFEFRLRFLGNADREDPPGWT